MDNGGYVSRGALKLSGFLQQSGLNPANKVVLDVGSSHGGFTQVMLLGGAGIGFVALCQRLGVRSLGVYGLVAFGIWVAFHECGIHATIAGVILGLITPVKTWVVEGTMAEFIDRTTRLVRGEG